MLVHRRDLAQEEERIRNQQLLRNLKQFPFMNIVFRRNSDALECAICLEPFREVDSRGNETHVVQL